MLAALGLVALSSAAAFQPTMHRPTFLLRSRVADTARVVHSPCVAGSLCARVLPRRGSVCAVSGTGRASATADDAPPPASPPGDKLGQTGLLRLGLWGAALSYAIFHVLMLACSVQLPAAFTGSLAVEKLLAGEIIFALTCKLYLETICAKYTGYLQWSLPLPIPAAAESFINAVLLTGVMLPVLLCAAAAAMGLGPVLLLGTFGPYFAGLLLQLWAWRDMGFRNSAAWPLVPLPFTAWRLLQLSRALMWLELAKAPLLISGLIAYVLIPAWAVILLGHLYMLPALYRWPLRDNSLVTTIGPTPAKPLDYEEDEGAKVLDRVAELTVTAQKLRMRVDLLRKMQAR